MLPNSFIKKFSWVLLFSMLFSLFSVFPEEPAYAAGEFSCFNSDGKAYAYQSVWDSTHLDVYRWEATTGQTAANDGNATLVAIFTASDFSPHHGDISEVNSFMMDRDGNAYAILKEDDSDNSAHLFKLNMPSSGTDGTATDMGQISDGDNNAGTYYENNGHKYLITSNGFMKGNNVAIRLNSDGSTTQISINRTGESGTSKAKDFTWLPNANFSGLSDGVSPDIIGFDRKNTKVYYGYISHTNQGASDEGVTVNVQSQSVSTPSGWSGSGNAAGAVFGFGKDEIYAINNNTGQLYSIDYSSGFSLSEAQFSSQDLYANNTTNNDGAACHEGSATVDWDPTLTAAQGTCDGSNRGIAVTLNNSSGGIAATYSVSYTVNGGGSNTLEAAEVVAAGNTTILNIPAQSDDAEIDILWSAANTDYLNNTPDSGTTTVEITVDTSSCAQGTVSTGLGSCSNGTATSTIVLTATNATMYFDVQYQINSDGWVTLKNDEPVSPGSPETYATPAQADGTTISWRYETGTSAPSSGSYTSATSRTVDCDLTVTVSTQINSCSNGTATTTVTFVGSASGNTQYYDLQRREDGGSWSDVVNGESIAAGETNTHTSSAFNDGTLVEWQYRIGDSNPSSGSYTTTGTGSGTLTQRTIDCDITFTITTSINSCSSGAATVSIEFAASAAGNTQYFDVEWSTDQSSWTSLVDGGDLTAGDTDTYTTTAVNDGVTVYFHYRHGDSNPSSGSWLTTNVTNRTIDCDIVLTATTSLNTCSNGTNTGTITLEASDAGNTQYIDVDWSTDGSSWTPLADGVSIAAGETKTYTTTSQNDGATIQFRYRHADSNPSSGSYTSATSRTVDCDITFDIETSINSCSSGAATVSIAFEASAVGNTQYFDVQWSTDQSSWDDLTDGGVLTAGDTDTYTTTAVDDGVTVYFQYRHGDSNPSSGSWLTTNVTNRTIAVSYTHLTLPTKRIV